MINKKNSNNLLSNLVHSHFLIRIPIYLATFFFTLTITSTFIHIYQDFVDLKKVAAQHIELSTNQATTLQELSDKISKFESEDQRVKNQILESDIKNIRTTYNIALSAYEKLNDTKLQLKSTAFDKDFALILKYLSDLNYASASAKLVKLNKDIDAAIIASKALAGIDTTTLTAAQSPPDSGYRRQKVTVDGKEIVVDIVSANLSSTKVIVDTSSANNCGNDCPVNSLGDFISRNGAYAGINGSYFCPASYPTCAGKTNSFDLLVMNKNKVFFNSDNNIYSTNPVVVFQGNSINFVRQGSSVGRDTGVDSMLMNYPLLVSGGQVQFGGNDDAKMSGAGSRAFVASKGNNVYIGVIRGVSVAGAAKTLVTLGMEHALNLDSGGSIALWANGGYKAGPGRNIPNAILFVRK